ncbi:MAG: prepilin peptidase [Candidatus Pacearchaeota archaeon]
MYEIFLICLALIWIFFAVISDFKKREIPDWVSFSLIAFAFSYRAFVSIFLWKDFFTPGIIGMVIFFVVGEVMYRVGFGGGDAKLLTALGTVLPFSLIFIENLKLLLNFFLSLMFIGAGYSLFFSFVVVFCNWKKFLEKFKQKMLREKKIFIIFFLFFAIFLVLSFFSLIFIVFASFLIITPVLLFYSKVFEELMVKIVPVSKLTIGDWLYENVKVGNKIIKPRVTGLDEKELQILQKYNKKVKIKDGIPFTISFLLAFLFVIYLWYSNRSFFYNYFWFFFR